MIRLRATVVAVVVLALAACAFRMGLDQPPNSKERIAEIVASPDRRPAELTNDRRRQPQDMLAFIGIRPGITALDVSAAAGYTTELLARSIGPKGVVYGQAPQRDPNRPPPRPANPEGNSNPNIAAETPPPTAARGPSLSSAENLALRDKSMKEAGVAAAPIVAVPQPFENPVPAELANGKLDLVTLMFNYHDFGFMGVDRAQMNSAIFKALKPGGTYVIADHAGRPGTGISESGTLHRVEEAFVRREVEAAGFKLLEEGMFLRNPNDPRDKNTPDPPQPKDEFVLKFVKPAR
jgi:predicted methyltransferase